MFEVSVWLIITLYTPDKPRGQTVWEQQYTDTKNVPAAYAECAADAFGWGVKAAKVNRGTWMLDVACQVRHEEAEPARGRE